MVPNTVGVDIGCLDRDTEVLTPTGWIKESYTNKHYMRVVRYGKRIFRILCEHVNGSTIGFNSHCCLSIMDSDGAWKNVADNRQIGFSFVQEYLRNEDDVKVQIQNRNAYNTFVEYIKKVYGDD